MTSPDWFYLLTILTLMRSACKLTPLFSPNNMAWLSVPGCTALQHPVAGRVKLYFAVYLVNTRLRRVEKFQLFVSSCQSPFFCLKQPGAAGKLAAIYVTTNTLG